MEGKNIVLGITRIALGFVFLWAFFDKWLGLGFATCRDAGANTVAFMCEKAWLFGGSPTSGFLAHGTHGPFALFFEALSGSMLVDWLFMLGLLGIGIGLTFGILMRLSIFSGVFMMALMYLAAMPPANNPFIDDHVIYALVLIYFWFVPVGQYLGYEKTWKKYVRKYPVLK